MESQDTNMRYYIIKINLKIPRLLIKNSFRKLVSRRKHQ